MSKKAKKPEKESDRSEPVDPIEDLRRIKEFEVFKKFVLKTITTLSKRAAEGDEKFFSLFVNALLFAITQLDEATNVQFDLARRIARRSPFWPTLISTSPIFSKHASDRIKRLELGKERHGSLDIGRTLRTASIPRKIATWLILLTDRLRGFAKAVEKQCYYKSCLEELSLVDTKEAKSLTVSIEYQLNESYEQGADHIKHANEVMAQLTSLLKIDNTLSTVTDLSPFAGRALTFAALTEKTVKTWADFGLDIILTLTEDHPENNPVLRDIGIYRKEVYYRKDTSTEVERQERKRKANAAGTEESNIKDGIMTRITEGYRKVITQGM